MQASLSAPHTGEALLLLCKKGGLVKDYAVHDAIALMGLFAPFQGAGAY